MKAIALIVIYAILRVVCTGTFDVLTTTFMAVVIGFVYVGAKACVNERKNRQATFTETMDGLYTSSTIQKVDFRR